MAAMSTSTVIEVARDLFNEAYEGPKPDGSWFVNMSPNAGVFGTIDQIDAEHASRSVAAGGRSIAAHVEHLRWSLAAVNDVLRGKPWNPDWSASWSVQVVDARQWDALRDALRREYARVVEALQQPGRDWSDRMSLTGVFAMAPHAAHHLGTIRQMARDMDALTAGRLEC